MDLIHLLEQAIVLQFVTCNLHEVAEHDPKKSQRLDFVEREWRYTTNDGGIAFRMFFGSVKRTGKSVF